MSDSPKTDSPKVNFQFGESDLSGPIRRKTAGGGKTQINSANRTIEVRLAEKHLGFSLSDFSGQICRYANNIVDRLSETNKI